MNKKSLLLLLPLLFSCTNTNIEQSSSSSISSISSVENISIYDTIKDNCGSWYVHDMYFNNEEYRDLFSNSIGEEVSIVKEDDSVTINNFAIALNVDCTDSISYSLKGRVSFGRGDYYYMIGRTDVSTKSFFNKYGMDVIYYVMDFLYDGILIPTIKHVSSDEIIITYNLYHCEGEVNYNSYVSPGYYDIYSIDENDIDTLNVVLYKSADLNYDSTRISFDENNFANCEIRINGVQLKNPFRLEESNNFYEYASNYPTAFSSFTKINKNDEYIFFSKEYYYSVTISHLYLDENMQIIYPKDDSKHPYYDVDSLSEDSKIIYCYDNCNNSNINYKYIATSIYLHYDDLKVGYRAQYYFLLEK